MSTSSLADSVVVTTTTVSAAADTGTTALPGISVSGYSDGAEQLLTTVSTSLGTLTITHTNGLTLSYGYSSYTAATISFSGDQADVSAALGSLELNGSGTVGSATIGVSVTALPSGTVAYLPATGHYYEYVASPHLLWTTASADAQALTFEGQSGYLATIPNSTVNNFINAHLNGAEDVWAGGRSIDYSSGYNGDSNVKRVWRWQGGPLVGTIFTECSNVSPGCAFVTDNVPGGTFTDWNSGEPNNYGYPGSGDPGEHYLEINENGNTMWNDFSNTNTGTSGYVAEFGNLTGGGDFTGVYSSSSNVSLDGAPGAPTGVSALGGNGRASVSWTAPGSNGGSAITGYTVTSSPGSHTCTTTTATSCVVTGLNPGGTYSFTVTATNDYGTSGSSSPSSGITIENVPGSPTSVSAAAGVGQATVSWSAPASDGGSAITGYTVTAQPGGGTCTSTSTTSCTVSGLTGGAHYTFSVVASNVVGPGSASAASSSVTPTGDPQPPTGVSALGGVGQAIVSWTAPVNDGGSAITQYTVTAQPGGETCTSPTASSCTVAGLTAGVSYTFTVVATNGVGSSAPSTASGALTPTGVPSTPSHVTATGGTTEATVSWDPPSSDGGVPITSYTVVAEPGGQTCTSTGTSCTVTGLTPGVAYSFSVTAHNGVGASGSSGPSAPVTPQAVTPTPIPVVTSPLIAQGLCRPTGHHTFRLRSLSLVGAKGSKLVTQIWHITRSAPGAARHFMQVIERRPRALSYRYNARGSWFAVRLTVRNRAGQTATTTIVCATRRGTLRPHLSLLAPAVTFFKPGSAQLTKLGWHYFEVRVRPFLHHLNAVKAFGMVAADGGSAAHALALARAQMVLYALGLSPAETSTRVATTPSTGVTHGHHGPNVYPIGRTTTIPGIGPGVGLTVYYKQH